MVRMCTPPPFRQLAFVKLHKVRNQIGNLPRRDPIVLEGLARPMPQTRRHLNLAFEI